MTLLQRNDDTNSLDYRWSFLSVYLRVAYLSGLYQQRTMSLVVFYPIHISYFVMELIGTSFEFINVSYVHPHMF